VGFAVPEPPHRSPMRWTRYGKAAFGAHLFHI